MRPGSARGGGRRRGVSRCGGCPGGGVRGITRQCACRRAGSGHRCANEVDPASVPCAIVSRRPIQDGPGVQRYHRRALQGPFAAGREPNRVGWARNGAGGRDEAQSIGTTIGGVGDVSIGMTFLFASINGPGAQPVIGQSKGVSQRGWRCHFGASPAWSAILLAVPAGVQGHTYRSRQDETRQSGKGGTKGIGAT